jgi:5'-phosphate synthase pdxT subunit
MNWKIGVLALQGDFDLHQKMLKKIGVQSERVRWPNELYKCDGLILPGGETTTFTKLLKETGLFESIQKFAEEKPVMGTCAGLITLATNVLNDTAPTLNLINVEIERNGYGRQVDSFIDELHIPVLRGKNVFEGVFIRAPRIKDLGDSTQAIGYLNDEIVMVRNKRILGMCFHPELTNDFRIHKYFVEEFIENTGILLADDQRVA